LIGYSEYEIQRSNFEFWDKLYYYTLHRPALQLRNEQNIFWMKLPQAKYNLDVGLGKQGEQSGKMLAAIEEILIKDKPDIILVQGDSKMEYINNNLREFYEINQN
jgi:UDP-N-acetylglucosamine 2-epimerase